VIGLSLANNRYLCQNYISLYFCFIFTIKTILAKTLEKHINSYFIGNKRLSKQKLVGFIKNDFPNWSDNTINIYLSKLKKRGVINTPSRGIYEMDSHTPFQPNITSSLKSLYDKVKHDFPYITFCIWDTMWLNELMLHQPFKHYIVVEVEKDASESIFTFLSGIYKNVFFNPGREIFNRYIHHKDESIIVKKMISESPLLEKKKIIIPTLEKLLVDMLIDTELFSSQQNEKEFMIRTAIEKYTINELKMRRYAIRRNRVLEFDELLNITLAKNFV